MAGHSLVFLFYTKQINCTLSFITEVAMLTPNACLMMGRCPGMRCQQANMDASRCESGDERAMVTSPSRSPGSPQTVLRENTPSPPSRLSSSNGPVWTQDAGLDNPAFEESTEEDSGRS